MASNIEFETIDAAFPVAGVDNNSQGFRDNFNIIRTSLGDAKLELEDLQVNAARQDEDNIFAGNSLIGANLDTMTLTYVAGGTVLSGSETEINIGNGHYHTYTVDGNLSFRLAGWPNENLSFVTVELAGTATGPYTASFISENSGNFMSGGAGFKSTSTATTLEVAVAVSSDPMVIDFWSYDNGVTVYAEYRGSYNNSVSAVTTLAGDTTITGDLFVQGTFSTAGLSISDINDIDNVDAAAPSNNDLLRYNTTTSNWEAGAITGLTATVTGDIIADDGNVLIDHINKTFDGTVTGNVTGNVAGDVIGSVFTDNSSQIIDSASGAVTPITLIIPSFSTVNRNIEYTTPTTGTVIFNTTETVFQGWNGTAWVNISV